MSQNIKPHHKSQRPLSPHLQIYRPTLTMTMSIMHRITGVALYFGVALLVWWLSAAASGDSYYDFVQSILTSWFGILVLMGMSWALIHHALGGIRHFIWDWGKGFKLATVDRLAWMNVIASLVITLLVWIVAYQAWTS